METRFSNLQSGDTGNVVGFTEGSTSHRSKLLTMGLVRDVPFHEVRKTPLGDPVEIRVNGFHFCLRRKETEMLRLKGYANPRHLLPLKAVAVTSTAPALNASAGKIDCSHCEPTLKGTRSLFL